MAGTLLEWTARSDVLPRTARTPPRPREPRTRTSAASSSASCANSYPSPPKPRLKIASASHPAARASVAQAVANRSACAPPSRSISATSSSRLPARGARRWRTCGSANGGVQTYATVARAFGNNRAPVSIAAADAGDPSKPTSTVVTCGESHSGTGACQPARPPGSTRDSVGPPNYAAGDGAAALTLEGRGRGPRV
jgi:hypothetical protein